LVEQLGGSGFKDLKRSLYDAQFFSSGTAPQKENSDEDPPGIVEIKGDLVDPYADPLAADYAARRYMNHDFIKAYNVKYASHALVNDTVYHRMMCFPVVENGRMISVEGRSVVSGATRKVMYPKKARTNTLFNYDALDHAAPLYVTEGIADLPQLYNAGLRNITSVFGSNLTRRQLQMLNEFEHLVIVPDNDAGGHNLVVQVDASYAGEFEVVLPPAHREDPGDCTLKELRTSLRDRRYTATEYLLSKHGLIYAEKSVEWAL
jgi:hypothetical protein